MKKGMHLLFTILLCVINVVHTFAQVSIPTGKKSKTSWQKPVFHDISYKVVGIKDGDTIVILVDGKELIVRLAHIDCPEKKQDFGNKAKQFVVDACFGKMISLQHKNKFDRNRRLIAEIVLSNHKNLNKELVKAGLAWHFKKYSKDESYHLIEQQARVQKIGIWSHNNPVAPWEFRQAKRSK